MPVVLGDTDRDAERFRFTLTDDITVVENVQRLDSYLEANQNESLIIIGPDVSMAIATDTAEKYRLERPFLGVVLIRRRVEVTTMNDAIRAGIREVILSDDVEKLVGACKRSLALSEQLRHTDSAYDAGAKGKVILVFSSKGGCGKTTISTNLAVALSQINPSSRVVLVDYDLETGDIAISLQLDPSRTVADALGMQGGLDERGVASLVVPYKPNMDVLIAPTRPADAEYITSQLAGEIITTLTGMYDYVIIDSPPAFTDVILKCFDLADTYVLLTTLDMPALKNLKVTLDTLDNLGFPRTKWNIMLNRSGSKVGLTISDVESTVGVPITFNVPSSVDVPACLNEGITLMEKNPKHPVSKAILALAEQEARHPSALKSGNEKRGLFGRKKN